MENREKEAAKFFSCSERERALFETGIKMGTIYHQFVGTPVDIDTVDTLENAIEKSILVQPFVEEVKITIDRKYFNKERDRYGYISLEGKMIIAYIKIIINNTTVTAEMKYIEEFDYPLMFITNIIEK